MKYSIENSKRLLLLSLLSAAACLSAATAQMSGFIVGGQFASIEDWPFIATIIAFKDVASGSICGSSLISSQTVLTAAHCLDDVTNNKRDFEKYQFMVSMGHSSFANATLTRIGHDYITHQKYDPYDVFYDIGILFLNQPVEFLPTVRKVVMIKKGMERSATTDLAVAGWGKYSPEGHVSQLLKSLNQSLIDLQRCHDIMHDNEKDPGILCAGEPDGEESPDSGDSGGPLARLKDQLLVGVVSYKPMYNPGITVFTSVAYYYSWIAEAQGQLFSKHCPDVFEDAT